jgi:hypothetical protein
MLPPKKAIALCGSIAMAISQHPEYKRLARSNNERVHFFPNLNDLELAAIKQMAHGALLPVSSGGGSNIKTAEALVNGGWIVATDAAFRGYEEFAAEPGVLLAKTSAEFKRLMRDALLAEPLELDATAHARRSELYWDQRFSKSGLLKLLSGVVTLPLQSELGFRDLRRT